MMNTELLVQSDRHQIAGPNAQEIIVSVIATSMWHPSRSVESYDDSK